MGDLTDDQLLHVGDTIHLNDLPENQMNKSGKMEIVGDVDGKTLFAVADEDYTYSLVMAELECVEVFDNDGGEVIETHD